MSRPAPTELGARSHLACTVIGAVFMLGLAVLVVIALGESCARVEGRFRSTGRPLGNFTFAPTRCASGESEGFFGAVLTGADRSDGRILVIQDPVHGQLLKVEAPGSCRSPDDRTCPAPEIRPDQCRTFHLAVKRPGLRVENVYVVDGHLTLDCSFPDGSAKAELTFQSCH